VQSAEAGGFIVQSANSGATGTYFGAGFGQVFFSIFGNVTVKDDDIASLLLDQVLGARDPAGLTPSFFGSRVGNGVAPFGPFPSPMHDALHAMFSFYSYGLFCVGLIVFLYYIVTITAETAESGTPFGRRFNHVWAYVRFVLAVALLVPLTDGFNGAQIIGLHVTKWGSNMATNAWNDFNFTLGANTLLLGPANTLVATPQSPGINTVVEFMFVAQTCLHAERELKDRDIRAYLIKSPQNTPNFTEIVDATGAPTFLDALTFYDYDDIVIRFGERDETMYFDEDGYVRPVCGEIVIPIQDVYQPGAMLLQERYYDLIRELWFDPLNDLYAEFIVDQTIPTVNKDPLAPLPNASYIQDTLDYFNQQVSQAITDAVAEQIANGVFLQDNARYGWAGAAIWYNRIAELNAGLISSAFNVPVPRLYPEVMEGTKEESRQTSKSVNGVNRFRPYLPDGAMNEFRMTDDQYESLALYKAQTIWQHNYKDPTGNIVYDTINAIMGTNALFDMRDNVDIHPLARLVALGRSMVEHAMNGMAFTFGSGIFGGFANFAGLANMGLVGNAISGVAAKLTMVSLVLGFILAYVVPFMPFLYFFFAVGGWIKGIFESMVGLPLWALAHLRIDGQGIPGPGGMNGWYMLLEIFIRPICIIFGMVAGISIFSVQVKMLDEIWVLVVSNLTGFDTTVAGTAGQTGSIEFLRNAMDQLAFTIMYIIIVYMMGIASFKLVDLIPMGMLRWVGTGMRGFDEHEKEAAQKLLNMMSAGGSAILSQGTDALSSLALRNRI
jgi:conjugal transfer/type IV secretion protein DotA/TraY